MPNINFTCPHCSHTTELASSAEGMKGNCPSCNAIVTISAESPRTPAALTQQPLPQEPEQIVQNTSTQTAPTPVNTKQIRSCLVLCAALLILTICGFVFVCGNILKTEPASMRDTSDGVAESRKALIDQMMENGATRKAAETFADEVARQYD